MSSLVLAAAFFIGIHVFISGTSLRSVIVRKTGEQGFLGLFSLLSLAAILWLINAYLHVAPIVLWGSVGWLKLAAVPLIGLAFIFVVVGLTTPNPTMVGGERTLDPASSVKGILRITRHPFLWGVAVWAFLHLVLNGDSASLVFFGTFLCLALIGPFLIDGKRRRKLGAKWEPFAAATSNVPFAAIAAGRNSRPRNELGWWQIGLGLLAFAGLLYFHASWFGVSPYPF
jgi:uncharacterized membrane protein